MDTENSYDFPVAELKLLIIFLFINKVLWQYLNLTRINIYHLKKLSSVCIKIKKVVLYICSHTKFNNASKGPKAKNESFVHSICIQVLLCAKYTHQITAKLEKNLKTMRATSYNMGRKVLMINYSEEIVTWECILLCQQYL